MKVVRIRGGRPLFGEVRISGSKNASLPMLAATLLTEEPCVLRNVPMLEDVKNMVELLRYLGAEVDDSVDGVRVVRAAKIGNDAPYELVRRMRASICLLGPLVGRVKSARISMPGGCVIGPRPIDLHLQGLQQLSCTYTLEQGYVTVDATQALGGRVALGGRHGSTVTGTANLIMAAVLTPGETRLECAAREPEIVNLCAMLRAMGAKIAGVGESVITITGVERLHGCDVSVIPDRIEAGTYLIAGAITGGDVTIHGARCEDLGAFLEKLDEAGVRVETAGSEGLRVRGDVSRLRNVSITTAPHPGFPTDLQAQFTALLTLATGVSCVKEDIYPSRFIHVSELQRMGADICVEDSTAIVRGPSRLNGAPVTASDLRASAALILAGLAAEGETWVRRVYHLDRGYEKFDERLKALGADIERLDASAMPTGFQEE